jgi:tRNA1Val (adenine37-N6)-methyltransferase
MSNNYFRFKQFTVYHDRCAMKVGTDGVLLGSWADVTTCSTALDIGTGTGLIALMLAQRNEHLSIDGIEIDPPASEQASANILNSPFSERIRIHHTSFSGFSKSSPRKYDLIISNPPYFMRSLKSISGNRQLARHNDQLPLSNLIAGSINLLTPEGRIALILPYKQCRELFSQANRHGLYCTRLTNVITIEGTSPKRILVELSRQQPSSTEYSLLILEDSQHRRTAAYTSLTSEFYL